MVFVGHGPAKTEIERVCREKGIDAVFMGYQEKGELARSYASADFFCFPSFTEVRPIHSCLGRLCIADV